LLHDQFDVLALQAFLVNLLTIIIVVLFLLVVVIVIVVMVVFDGLSFAVVVAGVGVSFRLDDLLSCGSLSLGVEVLNLGLAEDAMNGSVLF
jgi:hypothetical protein